MKKIILTMFLLTTTVCSVSGGDNDKKTETGAKMKEVILLGDSIRMGYQKEVIKNLKGKANVWAPEDNCRYSKYLLQNLDRWLKDKNPDIIHINVGLHDTFLNNKGECRSTPDEYADNLRLIFKKLKEKNDKVIIIFALSTVVIEERQITSSNYGRLVRRNSDTDIYNKKAIEIAKEFDIKINDLNTPMKKAGIESMVIFDGIHLSKKASRVLGKQVAEAISEAIDNVEEAKEQR